MTPTALGIDVGTTNVKVALVEPDGTILGSAQRNVAAAQKGDVAEQDADALWRAVVDATAEVTTSAPTAAASVEAIGCCSQYSSIVPVGVDGDPVAPMLLWTDKRGSDHSWAIMAEHDDAFGLWVDRHGIPPVGAGLSLAHFLHLQHDRPEVHAVTATWLEPVDWVNFRLTGRRVANQGTMFASQLCDNRSLDVTDYDAGLVATAGVDPDRLPPLAPMDEPVGTLTGEVAGQLGLPAGAVVQAGMIDTAANVMATGANRDGVGGLSIGTTSVLVDTVPEMSVDLDHEILTMPSPFPDEYLLWAENGVGGRALEHVLTRFVHATDTLADHRTDDVFAALDGTLGSTPAGSNGVLFLPWLNGSLSPNANAKARGAFLNLSLDTDRTDLIRATAEGVAHNLAWLLPHAEAFTGHSMDEIVFLGGAARSVALGQILADVMDRPVSSVSDPHHALARGAALTALARHGRMELADIADRVVTSRTHEPDPTTRGVHDAVQAQFEAAFSALEPVHEALNG